MLPCVVYDRMWHIIASQTILVPVTILLYYRLRSLSIFRIHWKLTGSQSTSNKTASMEEVSSGQQMGSVPPSSDTSNPFHKGSVPPTPAMELFMSENFIPPPSPQTKMQYCDVGQ